jgi:vacuolar-type H+-ATPase subunit I/STV1
MTERPSDYEEKSATDATIETRLCRYEFSEAEKRDLAASLANGIADISRLEDNLKKAQTQIKSEIADKQAMVKDTAEKLRSGFEMRNLECEVIYAYIDEEVRWVRLDNGEVAHRRRMWSDEKQKRLLDDEMMVEVKRID